MARLSDVSYSFDFQQAAQLLFLLGNQRRYQILSLLCANEMCVGAISDATGMTNSQVSHYLAQLRKARQIQKKQSDNLLSMCFGEGIQASQCLPSRFSIYHKLDIFCRTTSNKATSHLAA